MRSSIDRVLLGGLLASLLSFSACAPDDGLGDSGELADVGDEFELSADVAGKADLGSNWPIVRQGQVNRDVVAAQYLLRHRGESLAVDGEFSADTTAAAKEFQRRAGLLADGVVGPSTWDALVRDQVADPGDSGNHVRAVQYLLLNRYRYSLSVTGDFGPTTTERVKQFQTDRCIAADGVVGRDTWYALVAGASKCGGSGGGTAAELLAAHQGGRITLDGPDGEGSSALDNVRDAAAGRPARRSARGHFGATRVYLNPKLVAGMARLAREYGSYYVTSVAGGRHGAGSYHYQGDAMDIGVVRGQVVRGDTAAVREMMRLCVAFGATEVIGPSWQVPGAWSDANHQDHVHCGGWR
jgi:peptidoglycan hydrolase-like protein with peptidoglycan-binding domain